jgi:hypothetical protein
MQVFVYYNLHRSCWSVRASSGEHKGRVIAHASAVDIKHTVGIPAYLNVSKAGQERVVREGRKNVHAGIEGDLCGIDIIGDWRYPVKADVGPARGLPPNAGDPVAVSYNPYRGPSFYRKDSDQDVNEAQHIALDASRKVLAVNPTLSAA